VAAHPTQNRGRMGRPLLRLGWEVKDLGWAPASIRRVCTFLSKRVCLLADLGVESAPQTNFLARV